MAESIGRVQQGYRRILLNSLSPTRPYYEKGADLSREDFVAGKLEALSRWQYEKDGRQPHFDVKFYKLPLSYALDFYTYQRVVEVKCRENPHDQYRTFFIALRKWRDGLVLAKALGTQGRFVIAVGYTDGIYTLTVDPIAPPLVYVQWGGRSDRNDQGDAEPMVHIENRLFVKQSSDSPWEQGYE